MNSVEPIRDPQKIALIRKNLSESPRDYLLFVLGINFALRISDLLSLRARDVRNEDGTLREFVYLREGKTKKEKRIKVNQAAKEGLTRFFGAQATGQGNTNIYPKGPDDYLFKSKRRGRRLERTQAFRLVRKWCQNVGLGEIRVGTHTLRKTFGYHARKKGVDISILMEKFNHQSPSMTKRYIGITDDEISAVENGVNL